MSNKVTSVRAIDLFPSLADRKTYRDLINYIHDCVLENIQVRIKNVGMLTTKQKAARIGRNPKNGVEYTICARRIVSLRGKPSDGYLNIVDMTEAMNEFYGHELEYAEKIIRTFYSKLAELGDESVPNFKMEIRGLGTFYRQVNSPRMARNPKTGVRGMSKGGVKIKFKAGKLLQEKLLG